MRVVGAEGKVEFKLFFVFGLGKFCEVFFFFWFKIRVVFFVFLKVVWLGVYFFFCFY